MDNSSRTPEGVPNRCPVCGHDVVVDQSIPVQDAPCPHCGNVLLFPTGELTVNVHEASSLPSFGLIKVHRLGDVAVVEFRSPQTPNAGSMRQLLDELLSLLPNAKKILLDLAGVQKLSSATLGAMLAFDKGTKAVACRLHLCNLSAELKEMFQITRFDKLFAVYSDRTAAINGFGPVPDQPFH
jgi:anti-anti-sigma factor